MTDYELLSPWAPMHKDPGGQGAPSGRLICLCLGPVLGQSSSNWKVAGLILCLCVQVSLCRILTAKLICVCFCVHLLGHDTLLSKTLSLIASLTVWSRFRLSSVLEEHYKYTQYSNANQLNLPRKSQRMALSFCSKRHLLLLVRVQISPTGPTHQMVKVGWM